MYGLSLNFHCCGSFWGHLGFEVFTPLLAVTHTFLWTLPGDGGDCKLNFTVRT